MGLVRRGINLDNKKFFEHFKELNYRILISLFIVSIFFTIVYINYRSIYEILTSPLLNAGYSMDELVAFTIYEGFQVKVLNTFFVSIALSLPIIIFIIGYFFKPAFEKLTHKLFILYLIAFISLFYLGIFSAYKTLQKEINEGVIPWTKESVIGLYDKIAEEVNGSFKSFMTKAFHCPTTRGEVIAAGR